MNNKSDENRTTVVDDSIIGTSDTMLDSTAIMKQT